MPYKLRKAPKVELYWVTEIGTKKKFSKLPIPLDKAKAQMRVLESALHGGVLGIVGQATSYMVDDYKEAMKSNPNLPPIEELDQFLNPNDLLWMKSVLDTYKTWDNYLTKAKGSLELDFPKNLKEFLIERSAFTDNMLKLKYYLKHISRLLPPISKEKTLVERTAEAYARGELDKMPKPVVKKSEPPKPAAPKKSTYSHPLDAIKKVQLPPAHVPKPGVEGPLAKRILKSLIEKGAPEDRARQNATYLDLVRRGLGRNGGVRVPAGMHIPGDEGAFDIEGEVARSLHPPPPPRAAAPPPALPLRLREFPPAPPPPPPAPPARAPKRGRETPDAVGKGRKSHGGMVPVRNPMLVLAAERKARESIKLELDQSNAAIGFANGNYSMEEILQLAIASLNRKGEAEAIAYINKLIQEHSGNPNFKVKRPEARNEMEKVMGLKTGGKRGAGHTNELKAAYRELSRNANPQQYADLTTIYALALARLKSLPPAHPFLKRITGQPVNLGRDATKRLHLRQAIFDMNQVMGLGPHDDEEFVVNIPPNLNPAPPGENYNTECPICMEEVTNDKRRTPCGHVFHEQCFNKVRPIDPVTGLRACPVCRKGSGKKCRKCGKFKV